VSEPAVQRLGHGISTIPAPLPFPSPRWVNVYLIEGADGITMIDCGVDWEPGFQAIVTGMADLGLDPAAIHTLVVSHLHPDHVGMAPRLQREWNVRLLMHRKAAGLYRRYNDTPGLAERTRVLAERHGVPVELKAAFADIGDRPAFMPLLRPPDLVVDDGDTIPLGHGRVLDVLHTPGHEQAHICLRDSATGVLFSGDHVLPRITPVVMYDEDVDDALGEYLRSLRRLVLLHIGLTYPAHGVIVEHGSRRAEQIVVHHERRLSGMVDVLDPRPGSAWAVMTAVYRPLSSPLEQRLALRETVSHLEHLRLAGDLELVPDVDVALYARPTRTAR
jgi:glyoxylase-like metal-dependent hydrolase (beta-lactamase superfamily II)